MIKKLTAVILSLTLVISTTACGTKSGEDGSDSSALSSLSDLTSSTNEKWIDSNLIGAVTADMDIRLQDDFAAAANKEWKLEVGDSYMGIFQDATDMVIEKKKKAVTDESIQGVEAQLVREYYDLATDWDNRNSQGVEPLRPYIRDIESISSTEELFEFLKDLKRNPLARGPVEIETITTIHSAVFPDNYIVYVKPASLSLSDSTGKTYYDKLYAAEALEMYERVRNETIYVLGRLGYSESEADRIIKNCMKWEKAVAKADDSGGIESVDDGVATREEALKKAGSFPLEDIMNAWGFSDSKAVLLTDGYAKKLSGLCRGSNLERIKDYLIVSYCLSSVGYLDRDIYEACDEFSKSKLTESVDMGKSEEQKETELIFDYYFAQSGMIGAINRVYVENYFDDSVTAELTSLTQEEIDSFRVIFSEEEWLSDEGKKACLDKLSAIGIHVAYQSFDAVDYNNLDITSKEEGGSFLEAYLDSERFMKQHQANVSRMKYSKDFWDPMDESNSTTITNAFYNPATNGIYICAGICEKPAYSQELSYEEKLSGLFSVIGHEITHGFDKNGSQFDKDGIKNSWLPYEDQVAFNDRNDNVAIYYSLMTPFPSAGLYQGSQVNGEATADMGGLRVTLYMASKVPDFDYDKYFRNYACMYRMNVPLEVEKMYLSDVHPLSFYRINVGLQQFDEFLETYNIKEGDRMYLEPEKRIAVW